MATAADLMTLQQQIRQELADSLRGVREEMDTAISGRLDAINSISQCHAKALSRSCRNSQAEREQRLDTEELGRQP